MASPSILFIITNFTLLNIGWMVISHTFLKNLACATTGWKEFWLDVLAMSVGVILAASFLLVREYRGAE